MYIDHYFFYKIEVLTGKRFHDILNSINGYHEILPIYYILIINLKINKF